MTCLLLELRYLAFDFIVALPVNSHTAVALKNWSTISCTNMFSSQFAVIFTFFSLSFSQGLSSLNETIDASTCVAPNEYRNCYDVAVLTSATCVEDAGNAIQVLGCGCGTGMS
jgi:hypothetical protein